MSTVFHARHAMGERVEAECLAASDGFSARYDLDRITGVFSRPSHQLFGKSYSGRILVLDTAKGGVATAWMLHEMKTRGLCPVAIVLNSVNPILAQGAALAGVTLMSGFDIDITQAVKSGDRLLLDPTARTLSVSR